MSDRSGGNESASDLFDRWMASRPLATPDEVEDTDGAIVATSSPDAGVVDTSTSFRSRLLGRRDPYDEAYESGFEDMERRIPDTAKLEALTGWRPANSLDDIMGDVIEFERAEVTSGRRA